MKKFLVLIFSAVILFSFPLNVLAQEVNSFELFWPISAGRTLGDSVYFLKSFKEILRGILIFGKPQKADYSIFLTVKRAVETEKLITEGKNELAVKTLGKMSKQLDIANESISNSEGMAQEVTNRINTRLDNLEVFLAWLVTKSEPVKGDLQSLLEQVKGLNQKI
ncbi:MAG: hypothetical protein UU32_C0001G0021 [Candidatus Woesebacteria bacterium GW2011_GWB1_41_10]|uniref:DUF5667 domain-containing protein n=1 Tax=Candidatus Woesebacteria bacterium GW2011_GWB1_41_10 TaxID=1618577 RepID=A0A0G0WUU3_9BACT|nr:MAG: hypothetical protein UU32_C0001G0021 [Candidatus Woesebacteria bacterium GW2011_GWB1_41_10]